ncbi:vesicle-associated membrane protein 5 [Mirounga angustirostris]|uniref:vesicle-associated membrane protein 5 n=1 Tax=Mirounga leonina TaxID=9715 RepID=UPI00156C069F|nr:vesicle-associated membrane protein 5 [Mirounga leonina]
MPPLRSPLHCARVTDWAPDVWPACSASTRLLRREALSSGGWGSRAKPGGVPAAFALRRSGSGLRAGAPPAPAGRGPAPPLPPGYLAPRPLGDRRARAGEAAAAAMAGTELERCQRQADEVTEIMLNNFDKVLERDGKLAELEQRSDQLLDMSSAFSKTTKTLAQKKRWENIRCRIYLGLVVGGGLLVLLIVLLAIFLPQGSGGSSAPQAQDAGVASGPGD